MRNAFLGVTLLLLVVGWVFSINSMSANLVQTLEVPKDFPTIQAAIDKAAEGSTILIAPGVYRENIAITKSLTLKGAVSQQVILQPKIGFRNSKNQNPAITVNTPAREIILKLQGLTLTSSPETSAQRRYDYSIGIDLAGSTKTNLTIEESNLNRLWAGLNACSLGKIEVYDSTFERNGFVFQCIHKGQGDITEVKQAQIERNRFIENAWISIQFKGQSLRIRNNTILGKVDSLGSQSFGGISLFPFESGFAEIIGNTVGLFVEG